MGGVVVQDQMQVEVFRHGRVDELEEPEEFLVAMLARRALEKALKNGDSADDLLALRQAYVDEVKGLSSRAESMKAGGASSEEIARALHAQLRAIGVKHKNLTPPDELARIYVRNQERYNDPLGPTIVWLRGRGRSWEYIIESAARPSGKDLGY